MIAVRRRARVRLRPLTDPLALAAVQGGLRVRHARWQLLRLLGRTGTSPVRGHTTARRWCAVHADEPNHVAYVDLHEEQPAPPLRTRTLDARSYAALSGVARPRIPRGFVATLPGAWVMTPRGHVVTRDGYWLRDVSEIRQRYTKHIYRRRLDPSAPSLAGTALSLVSRYASGNYHHWLFNVLTRAGLALEAGIAPASVEHVLVNRLSHAYQRETLDLLPFQASTVEVHHREGVRAHAVVATSATLWAHLASWAHRFLRDLLLPPSDPSAGGPRRIFVCRGETASRPLVNEQECLAYFEQLGFVGVELATLPVREQAALFARATHVAGPHDAGLTNIAFCAPGATVIELFSPDHLDPAYVELGAVAGVDHLCAIGERCAVPGAKRAFSVPIDVCERLGALANL